MDAPKAEVFVDGTKIADIDGNYENGWGDWLYLHDIYSGQESEHTVTIRLTTSAPKDFYLVSLIVR